MSGQTGENAPPHAGPGSEAVPDGGGDGSPVNPPGDEAAEAVDSEQQARFIQRALAESARLRLESARAQTRRTNTNDSVGGVHPPTLEITQPVLTPHTAGCGGIS